MMKTLIISRRVLSLAVLSIIGVVLLLLFKHGAVKEKTDVPGMQVNIPTAGEVLINNDRTAPDGRIAGDLMEETATKSDANFYVEYRLERERTRGQRVEWLREVINNANSSSETRQKAQDNLLNISSRMEKEVEMENLIKAKGYDDAAVLIDDKSVTAVVAADSLNHEETMQLGELIARGTGVDSSSIIIIAKL
ncbi:SpoIIIAH-like family protein [Pelotomaculum terephthalicicum JT]|uniref:SpoIIIAH-like family protein n=1 Tax=Pelotomaculum terephthalicicum TaxID=206393 RepID=UPI001F04E9FE|nr:SpoIIIAH-like family protein [Pelotomaculum terephthalicicum]MCG9968518.1 SpoIIIAH-like family protein [Pelotomaculum terephthalicicum JT]